VADSENRIALRKLLDNERQRFNIGVTITLVMALPLACSMYGMVASSHGGGLLCALFPATAIILVYGFAWIRFNRLSSTRGLKPRLARFGLPDEVISRIDDELADPNAFFLGQASDAFASPQPDSVHVTKNWLVRLCPGGSAIVHLPDLAWVYRRLIVRSALLSHGRYEDEVACVIRNGEAIVFDTWSPLRTEQVVEAVLERRPEVLTGYIGDWVELATKPDSMWVEVQSRRERVAALSPQARDEWVSERWDECQHYMLRRDRQAGAT